MTPVHNIQYCDLPTTVHSFVRANPDDTYTIVINARLSNDARLEAYNHELEHIKNGDFDYDINSDVDQIELQAHALITPDPEPAAPVVRKRKRRKRRKNNTWKKRRELLGILGMDTYDIHEQHWLDPEYKF